VAVPGHSYFRLPLSFPPFPASVEQTDIAAPGDGRTPAKAFLNFEYTVQWFVAAAGLLKSNCTLGRRLGAGNGGKKGFIVGNRRNRHEHAGNDLTAVL